jgi:flagellar protein FliS
MAAGNACSTYLNAHYEGMEPKQLILMLYDGALKFLRLAKQGAEEKDIRKRGENLSKVIAIVAELNASLDPNVKDTSIDFLRSLYTTMLVELPRVSVTNDVKTLDLTAIYLTRLREIWVHDVMGKARKPTVDEKGEPGRQILNQKTRPITVPQTFNRPGYTGTKNDYGEMAAGLKRKTISA